MKITTLNHSIPTVYASFIVQNSSIKGGWSSGTFTLSNLALLEKRLHIPGEWQPIFDQPI